MAKKGWYKEPARHSLSARGIKSKLPKMPKPRYPFKSSTDVNKTYFRGNGFDISISSEMTDSGVHFPFDPDDKMYHNEYTITVKNNENGKSTSFKWYASGADYEKGLVEMSDHEMKYAVSTMLDDAYEAYDSSFEDWVDNYGYDHEQAERTYKATLATTKKVERLLPDGADDWVLLSESIRKWFANDGKNKFNRYGQEKKYI